MAGGRGVAAGLGIGLQGLEEILEALVGGGGNARHRSASSVLAAHHLCRSVCVGVVCFLFLLFRTWGHLAPLGCPAGFLGHASGGRARHSSSTFLDIIF